MTYPNFICIPKSDPAKRFLLGTKGNKKMLAIGLNPSTANEEKLDPTSRNIQTIANNNGCDGWNLVNVYPVRTSKPKHLPQKDNTTLGNENLEFIRGLIQQNKYEMILCCWGDEIKKRPYMKHYANEIEKIISGGNIPIVCIGKTKSGNPYHPAPMVVNRLLRGIDHVELKELIRI